jgi:hypothetical protein
MTGKIHTVGTRAQVWHGTSKKTSGGLTKSDLMMNKSGRIVSKSKHFSAKKENRLLKNGYGTQKGKFGFVKIGSKKRGKGSKKMRGGMAPLFPGDIDGQDITNYGSSSTNVQLAAGMAGGRRRRSQSGGSHGNANWAGDGIAGQGITSGNAGSANLQLLAGMAGGKRRRRRMIGGMAAIKRGGTGNRGSMAFGSDSLQLEAGNA